MCVTHNLQEIHQSYVCLRYVVHLIHMQCLNAKFTISTLKSVFSLRQLQRVCAGHKTTSVKKETESIKEKRNGWQRWREG